MLLIARRNHMGWCIPYACIDYATALRKMARYDAASEYLWEALSYDAHSKVCEANFASDGIPLALHIDDEKMLSACARESTIAPAFRSGEPTRIAEIAAAFAELYEKRGDQRKAQNLLHDALQYIQYADFNWNLLLEVAKQGKREDILRARKFLEVRTCLPEARVTYAYLSLFDAFMARREKRVPEMHIWANEAVERFEELRWYGYATVARTLLPTEETVRTPYDIIPFVNVQTLTSRERQVAELVLKGLTNHEVANELSMGERTVESHMTSIMAKLGIRSRYQLGGILGSGL